MSNPIKEVVDKNVIEGTRYFISLVELGSYTAVKNFYSVEINTVRSKLELLESYLGVKLTQPNSNKIEITKDGMKYYSSCHRLYTDLEHSILSAKYKGIDTLDYIRVYGTRFFINYLLENLPELENSKKYTFSFDSYLLYHTHTYFHHLNNYDIAIITARDLEKIDQDRWLICAYVDSASMPSKLYAGEELIKEYDLDNEPRNIFKVPFIFRRDRLEDQSLDFSFDDDDSNFFIKNIKYIVEDDAQKLKLIQNNLGVGVLADNYDQILKLSSVRKIKGISAKTFHDRQAIIVSKYLKDRTKIMKFLKDQVDKYISLVLKGEL
ncbi:MULTISPECIES: LysR family transcriptional regulator [unclassified Francisella]|uniref:LysR family transcriptional regulator n=1 Tax=unclassified Francisella TaxID=2610885 RepID=UPI002E330006|nr:MULTISPECIES: LysR family transcriptional regulator [unclassified Francisella]MED7819911.1 LysR family transcriptional regulator [Francisella sp. 19S2-4]MED7830713.1 LysR family transcriptional regulator [Francisella sp. 19S2-10]